RSVARAAGECRHGRDINDAAFLHIPEGRMGKAHRCENMQAMHIFLTGEFGFPEAAERPKARIVDEQFEAWTFGNRAFDSNQPFFAEKIGCERLYIDGEFPGKLFEAAGTSRDQD